MYVIYVEENLKIIFSAIISFSIIIIAAELIIFKRPLTEISLIFISYGIVSLIISYFCIRKYMKSSIPVIMVTGLFIIISAYLLLKLSKTSTLIDSEYQLLEYFKADNKKLGILTDLGFYEMTAWYVLLKNHDLNSCEKKGQY